MQVSSKLRRAESSYFHWCPGCCEMHPLPDRWVFVNRDLEFPTFTPSFKHMYSHPHVVCHYILTAGVLNFCGDCTHALSGAAVPLPELPSHMRDP